MQLKDKIALVTGAGQGIGRATALAMARDGAHVVCADINSATAGETAAAVASMGRKSIGVAADLGNVAEIDRMVSEAVAAFGAIDILVNNAGVTRRAYIMDLEEADWDRIHRVNAKGVFFCLQRVAKEMIPRRQGVIINIASVAGKGFIGTSNAVYAASKGAVISMTFTAAQQLGQHNINVNAVCPGIVMTAMVADLMRTMAEKEGKPIQEIEERMVSSVPLKRANRPEDIAEAVVFLASPAARNITGQTLNVDGGLIPG
ncbi:MAG: 3-oxoacyl-ACP reductase family protein [Hyphomicrobiaceae bacterium]|nr:3-oxoacyl-ACP reductase family protein [Hyphomicrobiaceae bacterium]